MKRNLCRLLLALVITLLGAAPALTLQSCGTTHSYWGIESDYDWGDGGNRFVPGRGPHKHHKPKHYKPKHKKPKHHKHHDWDD